MLQAARARLLVRAVLQRATLALLFTSHAALGQVEQVRFGNLHGHTSYSDGRGTPDEAFRDACAAPGIDFFAITEHNHKDGDGKQDAHDGVTIFARPELYKGSPVALIEAANARNRPGECVTLYGQEFSTISTGNHVNVFDVSDVIPVPNGRFNDLLTWMANNPDSTGHQPLLQLNHPRTGKRARNDYGRDDFGGDETGWIQAMSPHASLIEVFNAPALKDGRHERTDDKSSLYLRHLNLGFHLAPSVGQDNHYRNWGISTDARVAVITPDFTRAGILNALRARRAYASEDFDLRVVFRVGDALQGDIVQPPALGSELPLTVQIVDEDEPAAVYRVDVFKDVAGDKPASAPVESFEFTGNQTLPLALEGVRFEQEGEYVLLRITQLGSETDEHPVDDVVWTAPVWFESGATHDHGADLPALRIVQLVPDPVGEDLINEQITLRNFGNIQVSLAGWQVRDLAGNTWELTGWGQLSPGESRTILRNGQPMSLNNGGDEIELVAPDGSVAQGLAYEKVSSGQVIQIDAR